MLLKCGLLVLACIVAVCQGSDDEYPIQPMTGVSPASTTTLDPSTTTSSTTPAPTVPTTNSSTTSTTTTTTTTSTAPPTSTSTVPSTTVSTPAPTSSPSNATTTTVAPTTLPPATVGKWRVKDGATNVTCLMADMAIQVDVAMDVNKTDHFMFDVPSNASSSDSKCGNTSQVLVLTWGSEGNNSLMFQFDVNGTNFVLSQIMLKVIHNATVLTFQNDVKQFPTSLTKSYHCAKEQAIKLQQEGNKTAVATLKVNSVQWEAFHKKADENFSAAEDCATSSSPDIVPIAVGCALVGLVAIVLIAYLVGRRRSQARGYLSM